MHSSNNTMLHFLTVKIMPEPIGSSVPKFSSVAIEQIFAVNHESMALTCPAQSSPSPAFRLAALILIL